MGKARRGEKEYTREQQLAQENRILKRQVASLRKQLARVDLGQESVREAIENSYKAEEAQAGRDILDKLKREWKCHEPGCEGHLEIFIFNKREETWYYRKCNQCPNRTKSQKYDPNTVTGIMKKTNQ